MLSRRNLVKHRRCSWRPGMTKSEDKHFNLWLYVRTLILRCFAYVIKMLLTILSDKPHITCALPHVRLILSDKPLANTLQVSCDLAYNLKLDIWTSLHSLSVTCDDAMMYGLPCDLCWCNILRNLIYGLPCDLCDDVRLVWYQSAMLQAC